MLQGEEQNADADQDPCRHAARNGFKRYQFGRSPGPDHNPDGDHGIQVGRRGVVCYTQRHRHPQHQQETQRNAGPPEHAGAHQREACFTVTPQYAAGVEEAAGHWPEAPGLSRTRHGQFGDKQVGDHRATVHQGTDAKRGEYMPVCQYTSRHRTQENSRNGGGLHQAVGLHQLIAGGELTQNAVLRRGVSCRANAHQRVADKRVDTKADACRAQKLKAVGKHHDPTFREAVCHLADKRRKYNVSTHKHHL